VDRGNAGEAAAIQFFRPARLETGAFWLSINFGENEVVPQAVIRQDFLDRVVILFRTDAAHDTAAAKFDYVVVVINNVSANSSLCYGTPPEDFIEIPYDKANRFTVRDLGAALGRIQGTNLSRYKLADQDDCTPT
jgi:hypothetical protein